MINTMHCGIMVDEIKVTHISALGPGDNPKYPDGREAGIVGNFDIAIHSGYGKNKRTNYVRCTMFGKRAESLKDVVKKGTYVTVFGEHDTETYSKKDTTQGFAVSLKVEDLVLQGSPGKGSSGSEEPPRVF